MLTVYIAYGCGRGNCVRTQTRAQKLVAQHLEGHYEYVKIVATTRRINVLDQQASVEGARERLDRFCREFVAADPSAHAVWQDTKSGVGYKYVYGEEPVAI